VVLASRPGVLGTEALADVDLAERVLAQFQ
jgi:hypothetical protein